MSLFVFNRSSGKNLLKYQLDSSSVIRSSILMTTVFYKEVILQGEIWHWSLLGLKGLRNAQRSFWRICMWILVLKGLKQAIEAPQQQLILVWVLWIAKNYSQPNFPKPLPGWDTSPPQHCSQWYVASLKKTTKLKTCERRGKVRNSFLTEIKVAVSHKTRKKLCC